MFDTLVRLNGRSRSGIMRNVAAQLLEKLYGCEIRCDDMHGSVCFAHHARGCTIVAAKICAEVVVFQNVTIGANLKFDRVAGRWENVGNPIIAANVVICDGAKILGPIVVGENSVVAAGAIVTKDVPADSIATGVNRFRPKDPRYDLVFRADMIRPEELIAANRTRVEAFERSRARVDDARMP